MTWRFQKRVSLSKGLGLNVGKTGVSTSYRTKHGSVGSRGFSIVTGIPGLSYRSSWGKGKSGPAVLLVYVVTIGGILLVYNLGRLIIYVIQMTYRYLQARFSQRESSKARP